MTREEIIEMMRHKGTGAPMSRKKVKNNTYLETRDKGDIALRLHATDVVTWHSDGTLTMDTGGWYSATTKARLNAWAYPFKVWASAGAWHVYAYAPNSAYDPAYTRDTEGYDYADPRDCEKIRTTAVLFFDGITLDPTNPSESLETIANSSETQRADRELETDRQVKRDVSKYLKGLTKEVWDDIYAHAREHGTTGDCWYCGMRTEDGEPLGDVRGDSEHLGSHIAENYYMVSLAYNAVKESGYRDPAVILAYGGLDTIRRALRRYLLTRLLTGPSSGRRKPSAISQGF